MPNDDSVCLANYAYPRDLLPDYHHAVYQLLVGVEQGHSQDNLRAYAKQLRPLADQAFRVVNKDARDGE